MHLYFFIRGKFEQVELWKCHAQTAYWKLRRYNKETDKDEIMLVQGALRPSVLGAWEYIFPETALTEVCSFFGITKNEQYGFGAIGLYTRHWSLRKIFGCKKIPLKILENSKRIPSSFTTEGYERGVVNCIIPGIALHVIGIKKDKYGEIRDFIQELI